MDTFVRHRQALVQAALFAFLQASVCKVAAPTSRKTSCLKDCASNQAARWPYHQGSALAPPQRATADHAAPHTPVIQASMTGQLRDRFQGRRRAASYENS